MLMQDWARGMLKQFKWLILQDWIVDEALDLFEIQALRHIAFMEQKFSL